MDIVFKKPHWNAIRGRDPAANDKKALQTVITPASPSPPDEARDKGRGKLRGTGGCQTLIKLRFIATHRQESGTM